MLLRFNVISYIFSTAYLTANCVSGQNAENFVVESYKWCENISNPTVKAYITFKNFIPGSQIIDANFSSPTVIGENTLLTVFLEIEAKLKPDHWIYLFTVEDDFCRVIQMYIGELWYEVERAAALPPKTCPIPRGNYHVVNHKLDFKKLKLQTFPFGRLRITMEMKDKTTKKFLSCSIGVIRNTIT